MLAHSSRAIAYGGRDQPGLESVGFARRCRRFRFAEQQRCVISRDFNAAALCTIFDCAKAVGEAD